MAESLTDPRVLRAIAHPVRNRILAELEAVGFMRAADVAKALDIPANQASFHLRLLAKYGLIVEAPDEARDGRDRVWKPVHEDGFDVDLSTIAKQPGGQAVVRVFTKHWTAKAHRSIDRAMDLKEREGSTTNVISDELRLTKTEARQLTEALSGLLKQRHKDATRADAEARTYELLWVLQPAEEIEEVQAD